jgi:hypothetical protein
MNISSRLTYLSVLAAVRLAHYNRLIHQMERLMAPTCNIDEKGAKVRQVWGVMCLMVAVLLGLMAFWSGTWWLWIVVGAAFLAGIFALYEAKKKWCVVRAMGMKTPV